MASFNKIIIVGYLGADPSIRYTPAGEAVCNFSVATTERRKDASGEYQDQTTWFRVTVWRRQAEIANQYLSKGKQVYVEGRLRQTEYTDRDGNQRTTLEVTASDIQFLGKVGDGDNNGERRYEYEPPATPSTPPRSSAKDALNRKTAKQASLLNNNGPDESGYIDDDIPF